MFDIFIFMYIIVIVIVFFFFFNDTATTEIYTLSLHDALPIWVCWARALHCDEWETMSRADRKSTRLSSSHTVISYAVFCLKKKKKKINNIIRKKKKKKKRKKKQKKKTK